jgi:hypothetical protein
MNRLSYIKTEKIFYRNVGLLARIILQHERLGTGLLRGCTQFMARQIGP